jgi:hypothetical protein
VYKEKHYCDGKKKPLVEKEKEVKVYSYVKKGKKGRWKRMLNCSNGRMLGLDYWGRRRVVRNSVLVLSVHALLSSCTPIVRPLDVQGKDIVLEPGQSIVLRSGLGQVMRIGAIPSREEEPPISEEDELENRIGSGVQEGEGHVLDPRYDYWGFSIETEGGTRMAAAVPVFEEEAAFELVSGDGQSAVRFSLSGADVYCYWRSGSNSVVISMRERGTSLSLSTVGDEIRLDVGKQGKITLKRKPWNLREDAAVAMCSLLLRELQEPDDRGLVREMPGWVLLVAGRP